MGGGMGKQGFWIGWDTDCLWGWLAIITMGYMKRCWYVLSSYHSHPSHTQEIAEGSVCCVIWLTFGDGLGIYRRMKSEQTHTKMLSTRTSTCSRTRLC